MKYFSITDKEALDAFQLTCQARRHHSGAGIRACHRACDQDRAQHEERPDHRGLPVGPRRQGRVLGRQALGENCERCDRSRIARSRAESPRVLRNCALLNRAAFVPFITAGDPDSGDSFAILETSRRRRRRSDRTGHAVLRSHGGWSAVQASSLRALKAGMTLQRRAGVWWNGFASATRTRRSC